MTDVRAGPDDARAASLGCALPGRAALSSGSGPVGLKGCSAGAVTTGPGTRGDEPAPRELGALDEGVQHDDVAHGEERDEATTVSAPIVEPRSTALRGGAVAVSGEVAAMARIVAEPSQGGHGVSTGVTWR